MFPRKGQLNHERYQKGLEAKAFFMNFYNADADRIAIENPIPTRIYELPTYSQTIQPYEYGHNAKKSTCLWLKGLPLLKPTNIVEPDLVSYTCKSGKKVTFSRHMVQGFENGERAKSRSKTFSGIAEAMAEQWG